MIVINRVNHAKYLGLILDESLSLKEHIEALIKQLSKLASSYKSVRHRVKGKCSCPQGAANQFEMWLGQSLFV